jgi:hypothetical protein
MPVYQHTRPELPQSTQDFPSAHWSIDTARLPQHAFS